MKVRIVENLVSTKPKVGFYVLLGTDKLRVTNVEKNIVTLIDPRKNEIEKTVEEVKDNIIRYTAKIADKEFHVCYTDYGNVNGDLIVEGYPIPMKRNAREDDVIRVTDIDTIDANGLYSLQERKGVIVRIMPTKKAFKQLYEIQLEKSPKVLYLEREKFILLDRIDTKMYFHVRCTYCEQ